MNSYVKNIIVFITLLTFQVIYIRLAKYYKVFDLPNERSMHESITIRGGGVIYVIACFTYLSFNPNFEDYYFFIGLLVISCVGFLDDLYNLKATYKFIAQLICLTLLFFQLNDFTSYVLYVLFILIGVGIVNMYNFMDGINGITGLYSLVTLTTLYFINQTIISFIDQEFILFVILSVLVFLFFNFRINAICFGGDVGSLSIAFIICYLLLKAIIGNNDIKYIFLLSIYGIDVVYTLFYRVQLKQNILEGHKLHFFQILVYEYHFTHLQVSFIYGIVQLFLNLWVISYSLTDIVFYLPIFVAFGLIHYCRGSVNMNISLKKL